MKILHTADLHLGRILHGVDLLDDSEKFCRWLNDYVRNEDIDVVIISGDIYDRSLPPQRAVIILEKLLVQLCDIAQVILTSGNHDSAQRLGFASDLMRSQLRIVTDAEDIGRAVECTGKDGTQVLVYPIPYLDPLEYLHYFSTEDSPVERSHNGVMSAALQRIGNDLISRRNNGNQSSAICMIHAFVRGGLTSDSERNITVGGADNISAQLFDTMGGHPQWNSHMRGFDYVAAGHLHKPQDIPSASVPIRYSGSPQFLSFSECGVPKSVTVLHFTDDDLSQIEEIPIPIGKNMARIRGTLKEILSPKYAEHHDDYVEVTVTDPLRPQKLITTIKQVFPNALHVLHQPDGKSTEESTMTRPSVARNSDPVDIVTSFFKAVAHWELQDDEITIVRDVLAEAEKDA